MEIKILWADSALTQLESIFDYYCDVAGISIAKKLTSLIVEKTLLLSKNPEIGAVESLLKGNAITYRYIVVRNYKIIYRFNDEQVRILAVFDCRQNPIKMKKIDR